MGQSCSPRSPLYCWLPTLPHVPTQTGLTLPTHHFQNVWSHLAPDLKESLMTHLLYKQPKGPYWPSWCKEIQEDPRMYDLDALPPSMLCYAKWIEQQYLIAFHVSESFSIVLDPLTGNYFGQSANEGHRLELELVPTGAPDTFAATLDLYVDVTHFGTYTWTQVLLPVGPPTNSGLLSHQLPLPGDLLELQVLA